MVAAGWNHPHAARGREALDPGFPEAKVAFSEDMHVRSGTETEIPQDTSILCSSHLIFRPCHTSQKELLLSYTYVRTLRKVLEGRTPGLTRVGWEAGGTGMRWPAEKHSEM